MRKIIEKKEKNEKGVTLIEVIIAMGLSSTVLFLALMVFTSSTEMQSDIQQSTENTSSAQNTIINFNKDVRTSKTLKVTSPSRIDIITPTTSCKSYVIYNNTIYSKEDSSASPTAPVFSQSTWKTILTDVDQISPSTNYFVNSQGAGVTFAFASGEGFSRTRFEGTINPRVIGTTTSPCW